MNVGAFQDERVGLRPLEASDLDALRDYLNQPELEGCRYLPWEAPEKAPLSHAQLGHSLSRWADDKTAYHFAVIARVGGALIGHAECDWGWDPLCPDLTVVIAPGQRRRGYGSAVAALLLRHLFEATPAHSVGGWFADWNSAARGFARRLGFSEAGGMRWAGLREGQPYDLITVDLLRREWRQQREEARHAA